MSTRWSKGALSLFAAAGVAWACGSAGKSLDSDADAPGGAAGGTGELDAGVTPDASGLDGSFVDPDASSSVDPACPGQVQSFIWIANTAEGTLSKVCTTNGVEVARYSTSEQGGGGDPSRTSVNRHGDMVVTNRDPKTGQSSVSKFAGDIGGCVDRNSDGKITTSHGPSDVLPFGQDECLLWNTKLPGAGAIGARATAWDGTEDPKSGKGGNVWIGALTTRQVFKLEGDTGKIVATGVSPASVSPYGGAVDGKGGYWMVAATCTVGLCYIARMDMTTMQTKTYPVKCGYGISVDPRGRVWTSGMGCVNRFDPASETSQSVAVAGFNRGVAVDGAGSVWVANTTGEMVQIGEDSLAVLKRWPVGQSEMIGVAVDFDGYVWGVSQGGSEIYKIDPKSYATVATVPIGAGPYTYSDMTGLQLRGVIEVK